MENNDDDRIVMDEKYEDPRLWITAFQVPRLFQLADSASPVIWSRCDVCALSQYSEGRRLVGELKLHMQERPTFHDDCRDEVLMRHFTEEDKAYLKKYLLASWRGEKLPRLRAIKTEEPSIGAKFVEFEDPYRAAYREALWLGILQRAAEEMSISIKVPADCPEDDLLASIEGKIQEWDSTDANWDGLDPGEDFVFEKINEDRRENFYPAIYLICVEKIGVVYVGQSRNLPDRFRKGHATLSKLHDPKYVNLKKCIAVFELFYATPDIYGVFWDHILRCEQPLREKIVNYTEAMLIKSFKIRKSAELNEKLEPIPPGCEDWQLDDDLSDFFETIDWNEIV